MLLLLVLMLWSSWVSGDEPASFWPQQISSGDWIVTLYQPQTDSFAEDVLQARAAVSVKRADGSGEPVFGAVWLSAKMDIDQDSRTMTVRELSVPRVQFADSKAEDRAALAKLLETEMPKWDIVLDLDAFVAGQAGDPTYETTPGIKNDPPVFVLSTEAAVLLLYDGEPKIESIRGAEKFERVINTPFPVVREKGSRTFYLFGGKEYWYSAPDAKGPWSAAGDVPVAIKDLLKEAEPSDAFKEDSGGAMPKIVVATEPTELVITQGEPKWAPIADLDLLYVENSDSDVFLDIGTQLYYVLASGRWYAGKAVEDRFTWENVPNDRLPESFSRIPPDSVNGHVLAHISGTEQAREEALQNTIPQTAAVKREDTSFEVQYDGTPKFDPIKDLPQVKSARNTSSAVFLADGKYWACDNAVWYVSTRATGPWAVATEIPASLYRIPASDPHHNVTYVHIYETTPRVVYVGYTPGYIGSYWYHGCVVWGTGWYYNPWYGPYYYPRPWTWGLSVRYNPWYGWSFGVGWSNGPFYFGVGWGGGSRPWYRPGYGGWWGPGGYRPPYYRPYPPPGYSKPRPTPYAGGPGARPARPVQLPSSNIYTRPATRDRIATLPSAGNRARPTKLDAPNNVLTDRSGNVYRPKQGGGWETRENGKWTPAQKLDSPSVPSTRPTQPSTRPTNPGASPSPRPSTRPAPGQLPSRTGGATRPQLERDLRSRNRGSTRVQQRPSLPSVRR